MGKWTRRILLADRQKIEELLKNTCMNRMTAEQIAKQVGFGKSTVSREICQHGGREGYTAVKAQEASDSRATSMRKRMKISHTSAARMDSRTRLHSIEMQMKILSETVKELINGNRNK